MNPILSFLYSGKAPLFSVTTFVLSTLLFNCEPTNRVLQVVGLYQWKKMLKWKAWIIMTIFFFSPPSTTVSNTTTTSPLLLKYQPHHFLQIFESCLNSLLEYLQKFPSTFLSTRWIDLSSITRIQMNKNDLFTTVGHYNLLSIVKQCCVLLIFNAVVCCFWYFVRQSIRAKSVVSTNSANIVF